MFSSSPTTPSLTTLPPELLDLIITHLIDLSPSQSPLHTSSPLLIHNQNPISSLRLTSSYFSTSRKLFAANFAHLWNTWLDEKKSHRLISELGSQMCYSVHGGKWNVWALEGVANEDKGRDYNVEERRNKDIIKKLDERTFCGIVDRLRKVGNVENDHDAMDVIDKKRVVMGMRRLRLYRLLLRMEGDW